MKTPSSHSLTYAAINIGGTTCSAGIFTADGQNLASEAFSTGSSSESIDRLIEIVKSLRQSNTVAVGISCGGPLDEENGLILSPPNLPDWEEIPIVSLVHEATGLPCYLMNDANAGALAQWYFGPLTPEGGREENLIFLTCGTGMGAGLILNGRLYEGNTGMAGEIGHVLLDNSKSDSPIGYGKAGSIEGWCSGSGFLQLAGCSIKESAIAAKDGDKIQQQHLEVFAHKLGATLAMLIDTFNPGRIALGGIFLRLEEQLRPHIEEVLQRECLSANRVACEITAATSGENVGLHAALAVARYRSRVDPVDRLVARIPELSVCEDTIRQANELLIDSMSAGGKLLLCGNGGSAAAADHIAGELVKSFDRKRPLRESWASTLPVEMRHKLEAGLPAIALQSGGALASAFANDVDPELVYAQQVQVLGQPGDVLFCITTSGNSKNVLRAAEVARAKGLRVIGMTSRSGGALAPMSDLCMRAPASETFLVQEFHLPIYHAICMVLENHFFG